MADFNHIKSIFLAASEKPPAERATFLEQAVGTDAALRARVEALLKAHDNPDSFLQEAAGAFGATVDLSPAEPYLSERPGTLIGPYKLLEQIGEGGMGVVYMADQQAPVRRRVALKIIKAGMDTRQVIARFEAERQALALMDHSSIARVLDAGATESGRPYFVMELVRGIPITDYCDQNNLPVHERLELFVQVCHAVQHAHQKGIIHRDLKPSNVLVTLNDGRAVPKVIDFGIAKATGQQLTEKTLFTAFSQMVGTPLYMSPEQAEMSSVDIDTRSDIYSLGVLLYELLTGTTPFDQKRMRSAAFDEIRRIIREEEPPKPSTRISTLGEARTATAAHRQVDARRLSQLVEGDLDWIVMKAIEKDRSRRYETPNGLAMDIQRFLNDEVVTARPASTVYRLGKLVRRNRRVFAVASLIAATIVLGAVVSVWQAIRATRSEREQIRLRDIADHQRKEADTQRALSTAAAERERGAAEKERQARDAAVRAELQTKLQLADNYASRGIDENESRLNGRAALWFANAAVTSRDDPARVQANLIRVNNWLRGQWTPVAAVQQPVESADDLIFNPQNAQYLITYQRLRMDDAPPQIWDLATERQLPHLAEFGLLGDAAWAPDGEVLLGTARGQLVLASMPSLNPLQIWDAGGAVRRVAVGPGGQFVAATTGKKLLVWIVSGAAEPAVVEHEEKIVHIAFSQTGKHLVTATDDATAQLFGVETTGDMTPRLEALTGPIAHHYRGPKGAATDWFTRPPVFVDAGRQLVTIHNLGAAGAIKWYDTESGAELATTSLPVSSNRGGAAVSPDGSLLVLTGVRTAETTLAFDTKTRQPVSKLGNALRIAFSPDGQFFSFSAVDLEVRRVQQARIGDVAYVGKGGSPAFSRDGKYLAILQRGLTQVMRLPQNNGAPIRRPLSLFGERSWSGFSPNGRYVAPIGKTSGPSTVRTIQVRETASGQSAGQPLALDANLVAADFSPDGELIAAVTGAGGETAQLRIWNWRTGSLVGEPFRFNSEPVCTRFAPDGKLLAVHCIDGHVFLIDPITGRELLQLNCKMPRDPVGTYPWMSGRGTIRFSHDGKTLFTWGGPVVQAWDPATGGERWAAGHSPNCWALAESPDGKIIVSGGGDGYLRFWDAATGSELREPIEHPDGLLTANFSPDGRLVGTSCDDFKIRVWEVATGKLAFSMSPSDYPTDVRFTPDGRFAVIALGSGLVVWSLQDANPISPVVWTYSGEGASLDISADGRWAVIAGVAAQASVVDLQQLTTAAPASPEELLIWAELLSNARVNGSTVVNLTPNEWLERWQQFRSEHSDFRPFDAPAKP